MKKRKRLIVLSSMLVFVLTSSICVRAGAPDFEEMRAAWDDVAKKMCKESLYSLDGNIDYGSISVKDFKTMMESDYEELSSEYKTDDEKESFEAAHYSAVPYGFSAIRLTDYDHWNDSVSTRREIYNQNYINSMVYNELPLLDALVKIDGLDYLKPMEEVFSDLGITEDMIRWVNPGTDFGTQDISDDMEVMFSHTSDDCYILSFEYRSDADYNKCGDWHYTGIDMQFWKMMDETMVLTTIFVNLEKPN